MIPNADITVYNKYVDSATRAEKYQRAVVKSVVWESTKAVNQMRMQTAANVALVLIPFQRGEDYQKPKAWQSNRAGWTLQEGDIVARGVIPTELDSAYTVADLRNDYDDVFAIASVDAMDQGSSNSQHWEVNLK